ncbi:MAG: DUF177 domain-containing protein [Alphaproteobacteria bacterium]|nr:DUF177 domain-containing protein [Alphaproteobacteria bacterium]
MTTSTESKPKDAQDREFSHWIQPGDIPAGGRGIRLEANTEQMAALAGRFGLHSIDGLSLEAKARPVGGGPNVLVHGRVLAKLQQICAVTLEPVQASIDETFDTEFGPVEEAVGVELSLSDADPVEPFEEGGIDVGELAAQHLALALDPYPRAPGVSLEQALAPKGAGAVLELNQPSGPFAALQKLKDSAEPQG